MHEFHGALLGALALLIVTATAHAAPADRTPLSPAFTQSVADAIAAFDGSDTYKSADSGSLAWGESYVLQGYYWMYEATGDRAWLDRLIRHANVIFANLSPGENGALGWRTPTYSVARVEAAADPGNRSSAAIRPDPARIYDIETARKVTGHTYEVRFTTATAVEIADTTAGESLGAFDLPADAHIAQIPGVVLAVEGQPQAADRFAVTTYVQKPLEYVVHDGMILTPIAEFCAAVQTDPAAPAKYRAAARRYLDLIERTLLPNWEFCWRELPGDAGIYTAQNDPAQRFPGATLPHNQYLALARTYVAVYRATGKPAYRERAAKMARFFKRNLQLVDDHYEWKYWDYAGPWDEDARAMAHTEDTSHGHIDIGFAVDAYDAGIVFDRTDMDRFARTVSEVMWNGSEDQPRVGNPVNTANNPGIRALDWVRLGRFSDKTRRIMVGMLESGGAPKSSQATAGAQAMALDRLGWPPAPLYALNAETQSPKGP
jgi:hypothetical protein